MLSPWNCWRRHKSMIPAADNNSTFFKCSGIYQRTELKLEGTWVLFPPIRTLKTNGGTRRCNEQSLCILMLSVSCTWHQRHPPRGKCLLIAQYMILKPVQFKKLKRQDWNQFKSDSTGESYRLYVQAKWGGKK